jgi:hypothetical protein
MTASLGILVIRSSLVDWRSMKKECRHARHTTYNFTTVLAVLLDMRTAQEYRTCLLLSYTYSGFLCAIEMYVYVKTMPENTPKTIIIALRFEKSSSPTCGVTVTETKRDDNGLVDFVEIDVGFVVLSVH